MRKIGLIGVGWHARRIYVPWLQKTTEHQWVVGVDLNRVESLIRAEFKETNTPLLFSSTAPQDPVEPRVLVQLDELVSRGELDTLIISVDPLGRRHWVEWAIARGLDALVDKPLTAPYLARSFSEVADELERDLATIQAQLAQSRSCLWVQAQRRFHPGYLLMRELIATTTEHTGIPLTHLDISHADGMWVMPNEWGRDHHPYRHGWGKLLHSGYHFVDLVMWLSEADRAPLDVPLERSVQAMNVNAHEQRERLARQRVLEIKPHGGLSATHDEERYGEVDLFALGRLSESGHLRTTFNLQLMQSSLSRRVSASSPPDPYKGAGRIRHERVTAHVGPLLKLEVCSYQSHEIRDPDPQVNYGPGHIDHFDLHIYRNPLIEGARYERIELGRERHVEAHMNHMGHNESARISLLEAFLAGQPHGSSLAEHTQTHALLCELYRSLS